MADRLGRRVPVDFSDWVGKYSGGKKARYIRANHSLGIRPIVYKDSYITAFVKLEKIRDVKKDPRMIQARNLRYNIELGNYLKAVEHDLYNIRGEGPLARYLPNGRLIAKGLNQVARGAMAEQKWNRFRRPVQLALDCSRFDGHVSKELLKVEHMVYHRVFRSQYLAKLLNWQLENKCFTKDGVIYKTVGRRMSGDMNTALGNCVLMVIMIGAAFKRLGYKPDLWDIMDDGDDCCLIVEHHISERVKDKLPDIFLDYGHELKIESMATRLEDLELCGCRPVRVGGVRRMLINPFRAMGKALTHTKCKRGAFLRDYIATVGQCNLALFAGVPVLQEFALCLQRSGNLLRDLPGSYQYRCWLEGGDPMLASALEVTDETRDDFAESFGIDRQDQRAYEAYWATVTPNVLMRLAPPLYPEALADNS
jgi:hypothetical protein